MEFESDFDIGGYIVLQSLNSIDAFNEEIEIGKYAPGFIAFASDGGGEVFVFDESGTVYLMPLIGMSRNDAIKIADSWTAYESKRL